MPEVNSRGTTITFDDKGSGEPALLFMPGWCGNRRVFDSTTEKCAARRRILDSIGADMGVRRHR